MGESIDQVRELLSKDVYAEKGVWDMDRMQVLPVSWVTSFLFFSFFFSPPSSRIPGSMS
jgi:hypothetical protein